jgi:hypothetical protein
MSVYFLFELNILGFLSIPTYEYLKTEVGELFGGCASKLRAEVYLQELVSMFWCGELTPEVCPSILIHPACAVVYIFVYSLLLLLLLLLVVVVVVVVLVYTHMCVCVIQTVTHYGDTHLLVKKGE